MTENNERRYLTTKSSIQYDMRIYIDIPYDAHEELTKLRKNLNDLRPLNSFDRISDTKRQDIRDIQRKFVLLWIKYYCMKIVHRKTSIPSFIRLEKYYQIYFGKVLDEYLNTSIHAKQQVFEAFIGRLKDIKFSIESEQK